MHDETTIEADARRVEEPRREPEGALPAARRKLAEAREALNSHTVSLSTEIEYIGWLAEVRLLELDAAIRDGSREAARVEARELRRDTARHLRRVWGRAVREEGNG